MSGGLLWLYRLTWSALACGAVFAASLPFFEPSSNPAILGLRLIKGVILVGVAAVLLYRRQRDPVAALLALAFLLWTITSSFDFATDASITVLLDRFRFLFFSLALLLFPDGNWQPRWTRMAAVASACVFITGAAEALRLIPTHAFLPLAVACILAGILSLIARFRSTTDDRLKQQLRWVALALIAGVGLILFARAGAGLSRQRGDPAAIVWEALFQFGIIVIALGFLISLIRYRLFDAETVISRSAGYATLTIAIVATFGGTEALIQNLGQDYLGMDVGSVSGGMAAAVAALLFQPLHERITSWADHRFQPDLAQLKRELPDLLLRLSATATTRELSATVLQHFNRAVHATQSMMLIDTEVIAFCSTDGRQARVCSGGKGKNLQLDLSEIDRRFPVRLAGEAMPTGEPIMLFFGPRPDGTLFGREDLGAIRSMLPALRNALASAAMRERLAAEVTCREKRIQADIAEIASRLSALEAASARCSRF